MAFGISIEPGRLTAALELWMVVPRQLAFGDDTHSDEVSDWTDWGQPAVHHQQPPLLARHRILGTDGCGYSARTAVKNRYPWGGSRAVRVVVEMWIHILTSLTQHTTPHTTGAPRPGQQLIYSQASTSTSAAPRRSRGLLRGTGTSLLVCIGVLSIENVASALRLLA